MELHELDLNLLVIFNQLLAERRVFKVAESLGISQPAVSNSLAKLRKVFDDELFMRTPKGMEPTPFADQLAESVSYALAMIHSGVNQRTIFDPATAKRLRDYIYSAGNLRDPAEAYKAFRGRLPTVDALLRKRGLDTAEPVKA